MPEHWFISRVDEKMGHPISVFIVSIRRTEKWQMKRFYLKFNNVEEASMEGAQASVLE